MGHGSKVVVYGLSTEGYSLACRMAVSGAEVSLVDESTTSAISLNAEIAKTYPDVSALKEDEPLLPMTPIDVAVSKAQYLFFAPQVRKIGHDVKTEIHSKFKNAVHSMKKNGSVVYNVPVGFGGNNENITLLEHVTGFEVGKSANYFYYPISELNSPKVVGSFDGGEDEKLSALLSAGTNARRFVNLSSSEHFHAINTLTQFSGTCSVLEMCKFAQNDAIRKDLALSDVSNIFLDDMINGIYDLQLLRSSFDGSNTMLYLFNGILKGIDAYVKKLTDEVRATLKKYELKASKTNIAVSWTLDPHEMLGDRAEMLRTLTAKLRDYVGDVNSYQSAEHDLFHNDKTTLVVMCSKRDFDSMAKSESDRGRIIVKANPICEIMQYE